MTPDALGLTPKIGWILVTKNNYMSKKLIESKTPALLPESSLTNSTL